jgi:tripartite-type tricarboxylate transporter receptor subunit TctC
MEGLYYIMLVYCKGGTNMRDGIKKQGTVKLNCVTTRKKGWAILSRSLLLTIVILGLTGWNQLAHSQDYPTRPITLLINMAPGASVDALARVIANQLSEALGQEVTPVNRPGGGGSLAVGALASSKSDGYTLMVGVSSSLTNAPHIESVPYDPLKDVIPIIQAAYLYNLIGVPSDSPFNSIKDLIDFARKNPGKVTCSHPGIGTSSYLAIEYLNTKEKGTVITAVPFPGSTQAALALLGGHVMATSNSQGTSFPHVKAGKIKVLVSTADKRKKEYPNIPTLVEVGYPDGMFSELVIVAAPKGTPVHLIDRLEKVLRKIVTSQEYRNIADKFLVYVENPLSGKGLKDFIEKEYARNGEMIKKLNLK